jgi:hypothetical protein
MSSPVNGGRSDDVPDVLSEHPTQVSNEIESLEWSDLEGSTGNGSEDDLDEMYDDDRVEDEDWEITEKGGLVS